MKTDKTIYPAFDCAVYGGKVVLKDKQAFDNHLVPFEGKDNLQLILKRKVKSRSRQEEKFYHAVVVRMVAQAMSIVDQEAHEFLKRMFLKTEERVVVSDGRVVRYERVQSTTELGDRAYREYWEGIIRWAIQPTKMDGLAPDSGLGLYIPMPNEAEWDGRDTYMLG